MSGLELASALLGAIPLIVSGLEHWRSVAKVTSFIWRVQQEYHVCLGQIRHQEVLYKANLRILLLPIVDDENEVALLLSDPGGEAWKDKALQERLVGLLQDSYDLYLQTINEMNETVQQIRRELAIDNVTVQSKLVSLKENEQHPSPEEQEPVTEEQKPSPSLALTTKSSKIASLKASWDWNKFRLRFSLNDPVRKELFKLLQNYNKRLKQLLKNQGISKVALKDVVPHSIRRILGLDFTFRKVSRESDFLFKAIQKAWQCSCQQHHLANLRLEHRTLPEICFEIIFMSASPVSRVKTPWSWKELLCGQMIRCSVPQEQLPTIPQCRLLLHTPAPKQSIPNPKKPNKVTFTASSLNIPKIKLDIPADPEIKICQLLGHEEHSPCMGIVGHEGERYHLHPITERKRPDDNGPLTLDYLLSNSFKGSFQRRQRLSVALLLASSVVQLQFSPWLKNGLTKKDVLFFPCLDDDRNVLYYEPYIRRGFTLDHPTTPASKLNFISLGILLVELCFCQRLEDYLKQLAKSGKKNDASQSPVLKWAQDVGDQEGTLYASAVSWCLLGSAGLKPDQSWRAEMIRNVISPLEESQMR